MLRLIYVFLLCCLFSSAALAQDEQLPPIATSPSPSPSPSPTPPDSIKWTVDLFNGDDQVFLECNGKLMRPVAGFNQRVTVNLSTCLIPGHRNDIYIRVKNGTGAIAWGWQFYKNGQRATTVSGNSASGGCGKAGVVGCDNNQSYPAGYVRTKHYWFEY